MRARARGVAAGMAAGLLAVAAATPAMAQTDTAATDAYVAAIVALDGRAAVLVTDVEAVNAAWDNGEATLDNTLDELSRIQTETNAIASELAALEPPEDLEGQHAVMQATIEQMSVAAADMITGLRTTDTGDARQTAAIAYLSAATDFADLAFLLQGGAQPTTTTTTTAPPETTTTTTSQVEGTTSTQPAATTTTAVAPLPEEQSDGSGAPWVLLPVVMIFGVVLGLVAGLLIGRRARFELIETLRRLRGGEPPPAAG